MGAPLKYELECGHCGSMFTLEEGAVTRQVRCPICGGALTVAVPIPIVPVVAPPPPVPAVPERVPHPTPAPPRSGIGPGLIPAPGFPPFPFPPFTPAPPDLSDLTPELRARYLSPPWPAVRAGLEWARYSAYLALPLFIGLLCADLVARPLVRAGDRSFVLSVMWVLALAQVFPLLTHTVGQIICTAAPAPHGGHLVATSTWLLGLAATALVGLLLPDLVLLALLGGGGMALLSFGIWLQFLGRLGQRLGDRALEADAWAYGSWFWSGLLVGLLLLGGVAMVTFRGAGENAIVWFGRAAVGAIGVGLLFGYAVLLRTASVAVARRGPVKHKP